MILDFSYYRYEKALKIVRVDHFVTRPEGGNFFFF